VLTFALALGSWSATADSDLQRRPGRDRPEPRIPEQPDPNRASGIERIDPIRPPEDAEGRSLPVPDRWRILNSLGVTEQNWWDPYSQNTYKAD
jgi:hypothetical protein